MAKGTYISINTANIGAASAQAKALGGKMETTRNELNKLQSQLSQEQNVLEKYFGMCFYSAVPTRRLQDQKQMMDQVVSLLAEAEQLAQESTNKLNNKTSALQLAVKAMGGLTATVYTSAVSLITSALTGERECGDDWVNVGDFFTARIKPPTTADKYFGEKATKANCTTYAANRAREILGDTSIKFSGDAKEWWKYRDKFAGYSTNANEPRIGALMIWGKEGYSGPGHVAVVEDIIYNKDGSVKTVIYSESAYGGIWYKNLNKKEYGQYNWYGNATSYWGCTGQTPEQIKKVTQTLNDEKKQMGFVGYIYLQ